MNSVIIQRSTINAISDSISRADSYYTAKNKFVNSGHFTKGAEKALDEFFNRQVIQFKNGSSIQRKVSAKGKERFIVRNSRGNFKSTKGYGKYKKELRKKYTKE